MINRIYGYLAAVGGIILAIGAVFLRGKSAGKQQQEAKHNESVLKATQEAIHKSHGKPISRDDIDKLLRDGEI